MRHLLLLRLALSQGVFRISKLFAQSMRQGQPVDVTIIDAIIRAMDDKARRAVAGITQDSLSRLITVDPQLLALKELISQRQRSITNAIRGHRFIVNESRIGALTIGRRGQDMLREISLRTIEQGFLRGNPRAFTSKELAKKINKRGVFVRDNISQDELHALHGEIGQKIPVLQSPDGVPRFWLRNKNGDFMKFEVDYYTDLVARTTADEATETATEIRAQQAGTRFIKFNKLGKDYTGDPQCQAIDGNVFSIVKEIQNNNIWGAEGKSGRFYPFWKNAITSGFMKPHPFCKHLRSPYPEAVA